MTRLVHVGRRALAGLRAAPLVHATAALVVAVALGLSGLAVAGSLAARALGEAWGLGSALTVYLAPDAADADGTRARVAELAGAPARLVSPDEALARLRASLGADGELLDDLPANPLPFSIEVAPAAGTPEAALALAMAIRGLPGVAEVDDGSRWTSRFGTAAAVLRAGGALLLAVILLGAAVLAGSAVRLGVWARRDEIAILRLVGATPAFIRAPFLVEGFLAGLAGGSLAALGLFGLAAWAAPHAAALPLPPELSPLALARPLHLAAVAGAGGILGLLASAVSVGRHLRG